MDGIVNYTRSARARTLPGGPGIRRTGTAPLPPGGALGQGEEWAYLYEPSTPAPSLPMADVLRERMAPPGEVVEPLQYVPTEYQFPTGEGEVLLRRGDRGDQVRALQLQLRRLGFPVGKVDGIYGPLTEQAVRQFQESVNLTATGQVDDVTSAAVQSAVPSQQPGNLPAPSPPPSPAPRSPTASQAPSAPAPAQQFLGLPLGVWVALGVVVVALVATGTPAPMAATRTAPGPAPRPAPAK